MKQEGSNCKVASPFLEIVEKLIQSEMGTKQDPITLATATEKVFEKLFIQLSNLIDPEGFHALLKRAQRDVIKEYSFLQGVDFYLVESSFSIKGLRERLEGSRGTFGMAGLCRLLSRFLELLSALIGEDLTKRQLKQAYPAIVSGRSSS